MSTENAAQARFIVTAVQSPLHCFSAAARAAASAG